MKKYYHFAGLDIQIDIPDDKMYENERWLGEFASTMADDAHCFRFHIADTLETPKGECVFQDGSLIIYKHAQGHIRYIGTVKNGWNQAYMRAEHCGRDHAVQLLNTRFTRQVSVNTVMNALAVEHLVAGNGGFVSHCSYIERKGKAILFTAPSGTGKSTQADLWNQLRETEIVNGDRAVVRIVDGEVIAEGIPFAGSSKYCKNRSLPLQAIVYLAQAPETTIRRMKGYEAFKRIWEGVSVNTWDPEDMALVSSAVEKTAKSVPVYYMPCTPDESAVIALERSLSEIGE